MIEVKRWWSVLLAAMASALACAARAHAPLTIKLTVN